MTRALIAVRAGKWWQRATSRRGPFQSESCSMCLPGPVWSRRHNGGAPLSALIVPRGARGANALVSALAELFEDPSIGRGPDVQPLMQRLVRTAAGPREQTRLPAAELAAVSTAKRVVIIAGQPAAGWRSNDLRKRQAEIAAMHAAALREHPGAEVWIWSDADITFLTMPASGQRSDRAQKVRCVPLEHNLLPLLPKVTCVYTVDAIEALHAIFSGVPVRVFGTPFYAGWGLTADEQTMPERRARPGVDAMFDALYLRLARYIDPSSRQPGTLANVLDAIELQRAVHDRYADLGRVVAVGFQMWKRRFAAPFIAAGGGALRWSRAADSLRRDEWAVLWGARNAEKLAPGTRVARIEDGFLHSCGLGSDMSAPRSQVIDREGIYFDARRPNELTRILNSVEFDKLELVRAANLRRLIVQAGLTKYNLGRRAPAWQAPEGRRILLVIGQVGDDASVRYGTGVFRSVDAMLGEVRARNPAGFVVYKPHPDVLSGNRTGLVDAGSSADIVDTEADLISLIESVDEVHTLSSLAGFDALLRGKQVFTYGLPFYSGWGLTHDALAHIPERRRALTLDMLVAGVLLHYPLYWDWQLRMFTTPEAVIADLAVQAARPLDIGAGRAARTFKKAFRWSRNVLLHAIRQARSYSLHSRLFQTESN